MLYGYEFNTTNGQHLITGISYLTQSFDNTNRTRLHDKLVDNLNMVKLHGYKFKGLEKVITLQGTPVYMVTVDK